MPQDFSGQFIVLNKPYKPDFILKIDKAQSLSSREPFRIEDGYEGGEEGRAGLIAQICAK